MLDIVQYYRQQRLPRRKRKKSRTPSLVRFRRRRVLAARDLGRPSAARTQLCAPPLPTLACLSARPAGDNSDCGTFLPASSTRHRVVAFRDKNWKKYSARGLPPPWRPSDTNSFSSATPRERGSSWGETCK